MVLPVRFSPTSLNAVAKAANSAGQSTNYDKATRGRRNLPAEVQSKPEALDHSDLEPILGPDLKPKTYGPGHWNRFNPDFVYRHRQVTAEVSTTKLAAALVAMTHHVDAYADRAGYDVGFRETVGPSS